MTTLHTLLKAREAKELEILRRARELLADPKKWVKDTFATTATGDSCEPESPQAACFCSIGAVRRARAEMMADGTELSRTSVVPRLGNWVRRNMDTQVWGVAEYNDSPRTTHADVLAMFDGAIAEMEKANG